jgi:ABC-type sugar transport system ATPase subunit
MSVFDNIAYPLRSRKLNKADIQKTVQELAELTNITPLLNGRRSVCPVVSSKGWPWHGHWL